MCQFLNWSIPPCGKYCRGVFLYQVRNESILVYTDPCTIAMNSFNSYLESLPSFITQTDADWGMVYDWMEEMCGELTDTQWEEVAEVYKEFMNDSRY